MSLPRDFVSSLYLILILDGFATEKIPNVDLDHQKMGFL